MTQDKEHEQALQVTADSLMTEQHALQKRLQQLTLEYDSEADTVQQLQSGEASDRAHHLFTQQPSHNQLVSAAVSAARCLSFSPAHPTAADPGLMWLVWLCADVDATRADLDLRLAKLDELHNAYQNALGLKLQSEDGTPPQQGVGWHAGASSGCYVQEVHGTSVVECVLKVVTCVDAAGMACVLQASCFWSSHKSARSSPRSHTALQCRSWRTRNTEVRHGWRRTSLRTRVPTPAHSPHPTSTVPQHRPACLLCSCVHAVTRCEPDVPQRAVLEQQLLEGRIEFAGFVRAMRTAFKLAAEEAAEEQHA